MTKNYLEKLLLNSIEKNTPYEIKSDKVFDYNNKEGFTFNLTKNIVEKLKIKEWFKGYEKEARVSTAGIRGVQNVLYPHDMRFPINTIGITLATLAKALVLKEKYKNCEIVKLAACEVRYNSKIYLDIISRLQAYQGITTLVPTNKQTIPIWLASFLAFKLDLAGAEYITSSHGISVKNATKDLNNQGSQFLPDESMEFVEKMREILETVDKTGEYKIHFAQENDKNINEEAMKRLDNGIDLYVEYLKSSVAHNLDDIKKFDKKIVIDSVGGCAYKTSSKILDKLGISDKFVWFNVEEDPFFHSIGKYEKIDKTGEKVLYDYSLDVTVSAKDENGKEYFPVINSMKYDEKLQNMENNTAVLITDPDHDRLNIVQVQDIKHSEEIKKAGVDIVKLNDSRVLCVFSANQAFLMIMDYFARALKSRGILNDNKRFIIKTSASSASWDEWAKANNIEAINTPVGFKEIANVCKKIEGQIENGVKDIEITDIFARKINLGKSPRLLFAGEESGGMITGANDMIESKNGRHALAMREKSASEAIILASGLIAELNETPLYRHLDKIYKDNKIVAKYDVRCDISYYNESETNIEKLKQSKLMGELKRTKNSIFYLALAVGILENKISFENAKKILQDTFKNLDFSNLEEIKFVGDGTYLKFSDKFVEIRPSGTDAKTKAYAGGRDKELLQNFASTIGNYSGEMSEEYKKYLDDEFLSKVETVAMKIYEKYTLNGAHEAKFEPCSYKWLV